MTRVLVVDDKEDNLYYLQSLLSNYGCTVDVARNGTEALAIAQRTLPDIVISDLLMPVMDGYTLLRQWKADGRFAQVPFIVYTATYTAPEDEALARRYGADAFILKPSEPEDFLAQLRAVQARTAAGAAPTTETTGDDEEILFKLYNESLVRKLEEKSLQLEDSNRALQADIAVRVGTEAALRASDAEFRMLAEAMPQIVWVANDEGANVYLNPQWEQYTGMPVADGVGSHWITAFHPDDQGPAWAAWREAFEGMTEYSTECRVRRHDGVYRWWLIRGVPTRAHDRPTKWFGTCTDIHDLKLAELEIVRMNRALAMLGRCHEALIRAEDERTLLDQVCRIAVDVGGYRMAWVGYAQDDEMLTVKPMAHAGAEDGYLSEVQVSWRETDKWGVGPGGQVIRSGSVVVVEDLSRASGYAHLSDPAQRRGYRGVTVLPLSSPKRTFGLIALYSAEVSQITADELKLLTEMANDLAFGIVNLRARAEQQRLQTAVVKVAAGVSAASGTTFYEQLARNMADALGANAAFVARIIRSESTSAESVAAVVDGALMANFAFEIANTPCAALLAAPKGVVPSTVATATGTFPASTTLPAEGFVGRRLDSSVGHPLGFLFVVFRTPPKHPELITSTLQIFAARAAAELERQQTDERVREQAALLDVAHEAILVIDLADRIVYWNGGAERTYGWTAEEALGRTAAGLLYKDPAPYVEGRARLMTHGLWESELLQHTRSGDDITVSVRWTLVRDAENQPRSILAINTDITEARKLESQFFRAQRMESIGTLASGIAHDLNNVLAPILLSLEMLKDVVTAEEDIGLLATLQGSAQRGAALVRQVLSFARGVEGKRITVDLVPLLTDLVRVAQDTFPKSITIQLDARSEPWMVTGDPTQMHQVFLNLLVNARDAMPEGGTITVSLHNVVIDDTYTATNPGSRAGAHVLVKVKDSGTGIPAAIRDRIFEPFFTTKAMGDGTGLGLSTTSAIVKSHGGFIHVYSDVGLGTDFRVHLPANDRAEAHADIETEQQRLPRGRDELILVVDDEDAIRRVASRTLERFGYRALLAANGAEAVALYAVRGPEIAAVLTDMAMPVMDGMATIIALKALDPHVLVIGSSGLSSSANVAAAVGAGIKYFVPKPYTAEAILTVLDQALRENAGVTQTE